MTSVLLIGIHPSALNVNDPSLPPGLTQEKIEAGIEQTMSDMRARGWRAGFCAMRPETVVTDVAKSLEENWHCVVIGGGIRIPPVNLELFETVVNTIIRIAQGTPIAFNTNPENSADAAARQLR